MLDFDGCPKCGADAIAEWPEQGFYYCKDCGWSERQEENAAPIGKIKVTCSRCNSEFECYPDDLAGWDEDEKPWYMCGTCERIRRDDDF
jgi:hypothetical protein